MQDTTTTSAEQPKQYQCRHIFTDGRRCASPCLRQQELCYYHHTTRKPVADPRQRRRRRSTFDLPLPEDRSAIQSSIGEVLQRIASNDIDPRRAGLLLYGLQIASLNLPKTPTHTQATSNPQTTPQTVEEITIDPALGVLAPRAEVASTENRKSTVALLFEKLLQNDKDKQETPPEPATIPKIHATADNPKTFTTTPKSKEASSRPKRSAVEGPPHFAVALAVVCSPSPTAKTVISTPSEVERAGAPAAAAEKPLLYHSTRCCLFSLTPSQNRHFDRRRRTCRRSGETRFSTTIQGSSSA